MAQRGHLLKNLRLVDVISFFPVSEVLLAAWATMIAGLGYWKFGTINITKRAYVRALLNMTCHEQGTHIL